VGRLAGLLGSASRPESGVSYGVLETIQGMARQAPIPAEAARDGVAQRDGARAGHAVRTDDGRVARVARPAHGHSRAAAMSTLGERLARAQAGMAANRTRADAAAAEANSRTHTAGGAHARDCRECHNELLRRCRATNIGRWVMRLMPHEPAERGCAVIDLGRSEAVDASSWKRRDVRVSEGATWCAVLAGMPEGPA